MGIGDVEKWNARGIWQELKKENCGGIYWEIKKTYFFTSNAMASLHFLLRASHHVKTKQEKEKWGRIVSFKRGRRRGVFNGLSF